MTTESELQNVGFVYRIVEDPREANRRLLKGEEISQLVECAGSGPPSSSSAHGQPLAVAGSTPATG